MSRNHWKVVFDNVEHQRFHTKSDFDLTDHLERVVKPKAKRRREGNGGVRRLHAGELNTISYDGSSE